ncbi:MAG: hypothetical protein M1828_002913 [Chrysothrix sp. TS-e1954]|nr:MAG: hypothetical protein M1828_002913 [Chrysothrix sp. TS-e1954]
MGYLPRHEARTSLLQGQVADPGYQPYDGGYHQREGIAPASTSRDSNRISWIYTPNSRWTWAFSLLVIVQALVCIGFEIYVFVLFHNDLRSDAKTQPVDKVVPTYLSLFIFGFIYQLLLTYDALRLKNTIQIIGLCLYNLGMLLEAALQLDQINDALQLSGTGPHPELINPAFRHDIKPFVISVPIIMGVFTFLMAFATWKLYEEFAWSIYKHISADLRLKRRFLAYQIYIALLKFDFFFFLAFTVQFLVVVTGSTNVEQYLTIAAIPVTVILLLLAAYWARKEQVWGMVVIILVYFAALAYFMFKLVRMYAASQARQQEYLPARHSLTTFAVITIVLLVVTIVYAFMVMFNFDKGLKRHVASERTRRRRASSTMDKLYSNEMPLAPQHTNRMTID